MEAYDDREHDAEECGEDVDNERTDSGDVSHPARHHSAQGVGDADHGDEEGGLAGLETSVLCHGRYV